MHKNVEYGQFTGGTSIAKARYTVTKDCFCIYTTVLQIKDIQYACRLRNFDDRKGQTEPKLSFSFGGGSAKH